jgi:hypothetical protein
MRRVQVYRRLRWTISYREMMCQPEHGFLRRREDVVWLPGSPRTC